MGANPQDPPTGRNEYDVAIVAMALVFLGLVTFLVVRHYSTANDAATILGILTPVIGAIFGASIGYSAGNAAGKSEGAALARSRIKADLGPDLASMAHETALPEKTKVTVAQLNGYLSGL